MQKCETFFCIYMLADVVLTTRTESLPMNLQLHSSGDDPSYYFKRFFLLQTHSCSVEPFQIPAAGFMTSIIWAKGQRRRRQQGNSHRCPVSSSLFSLSSVAPLLLFHLLQPLPTASFCAEAAKSSAALNTSQIAARLSQHAGRIRCYFS